MSEGNNNFGVVHWGGGVESVESNSHGSDGARGAPGGWEETNKKKKGKPGGKEKTFSCWVVAGTPVLKLLWTEKAQKSHLLFFFVSDSRNPGSPFLGTPLSQTTSKAKQRGKVLRNLQATWTLPKATVFQTNIRHPYNIRHPQVRHP